MSLPLTISEADFQSTIIDLARRTGWMLHHSRPTQIRNGRWATAIAGHPGLPDLVLARGGVVILAELKTTHGRLTPGQRDWLAALGGLGRCWRPQDWDAEIVPTLTERPAHDADSRSQDAPGTAQNPVSRVLVPPGRQNGSQGRGGGL